MYIGLISDTHGVFSEEFKNFLAPVDEIWHAGDIGGGFDFLKDLMSFKPFVGVYGNCDGQDIRFELPLFQLFEREGLKILMTHIGGYPGHYEKSVRAKIKVERPDIFICGHSHILRIISDNENDLLMINPGAAGIQGWHVVRTALRFRIEKKKISEMEIFELKRG